MIKRAFDICFSIIGLLVLSPVFVVIALFVIGGSKGSVFYRQTRIGKNARAFSLFKFRTMYPDADQAGLLTVGIKDDRITPTGKFLRKYKLDELPQLWNVLWGDMSIVGPRPEVPRFVQLYTKDQKRVLTIKPGLTDEASLAFINENEILEKYPDPEKTYIEMILPQKLELNLKYIDKQNFCLDMKIIGKTLAKILGIV